jgi:RNA polymerase sigma-70 factor, ECF subfamily
VTADQEQLAGSLMVCAQQGDQRAYEDLLHLLAQEARRFIGRRVGWADWAEDVVQEALLTVHRARRTYDPARPFAPWFYAILHSRLIDMLRSRRRVTTHEVTDEAALAAQPAAATPGNGRSDVSEVLARAVAALPRAQREVISLMKYEELSVREVALRLGMSESAVKTTAHRGYKALRATVGGALGEHGRTD